MAGEVPRRSAANWAGLRLQLVKAHLPILDERRRLSSLRRRLQVVAIHRPPLTRSPPTQLPFLPLLATSEPKIGFVFRLAAACAGNIRPRPSASNMSCIGSSFGWLILCGDCGLIKLFNPLAGEDIRLPHLVRVSRFISDAGGR
ncbi:hypothetical protein OPV22_009726 [Ensete ventricosum]|uniref:Uncharacterized protein n=1 Tax=Ensete ventricosum TaxID=4639 RepID=A0AAV8RBI0_ENSVE|nr:hypothetical protein OPV22_009726 [Ensete ventricosum]RWV89368.1 hypothetical protein GW17_00048484 [Ensete ventricosum]